MNVALQFLRRNGRLLGLIATAGLGVFLLAKLPSVVARVALGDASDRQYDARLAAERAREHRFHQERAAQAVKATRDSIVYVVRSRSATDAIAALPPATITADSITLPQGTFPIAFPVAAYIGELQLAVAKSDSALQAADTALLSRIAVQEKTDSLASASSAIADLATEQVEQHRPGFFGRLWGAARVPLAVGAGFVAGALVARAVP